jgi:hypothetical protein
MPRMLDSRSVTALVVALAAAPDPVLGQDRCAGGASPARVVGIAGGFAAAEVVAVAVRHDDWWTTPDTTFHFTAGGSPSKGQDLLLHGFIAYQTAQVGRALFDWACVPPALAGWLGATLGIAAGLPKEIGDGLHARKGFAVDDFGASVAGALLPALHRAVPASRVLALKVWYWPSGELRRRPAGGLPTLENDYAGQRYYLAIQPGSAPGGGGPWPDWLGVAFGHGVPHWASLAPLHDWYVALDLRFSGLPIRGRFWRQVAPILDQIHVPAPGIRLSKGRVTFGLTF